MGARIPGGSEDVLLDLAIRQAVKRYRALVAEWEGSSGGGVGEVEDRGEGKGMQRPVGGNAKL